jgi:hypothetical protein
MRTMVSLQILVRVPIGIVTTESTKFFCTRAPRWLSHCARWLTQCAHVHKNFLIIEDIRYVGD